MAPLRSPPANTKRSPSCGRALRGSACAVAASCISQPNPAPKAAFKTRRLLLIIVRSPLLNRPPQLTAQHQTMDVYRLSSEPSSPAAALWRDTYRKIYSETDALASFSPAHLRFSPGLITSGNDHSGSLVDKS